MLFRSLSVETVNECGKSLNAVANNEFDVKFLRPITVKDTQFIVITHRRGTMNAADALYGITMQEKGISTLISVDLIDKDLN